MYNFNLNIVNCFHLSLFCTLILNSHVNAENFKRSSINYQNLSPRKIKIKKNRKLSIRAIGEEIMHACLEKSILRSSKSCQMRLYRVYIQQGKFVSVIKPAENSWILIFSNTTILLYMNNHSFSFDQLLCSLVHVPVTPYSIQYSLWFFFYSNRFT